MDEQHRKPLAFLGIGDFDMLPMMGDRGDRHGGWTLEYPLCGGKPETPCRSTKTFAGAGVSSKTRNGCKSDGMMPWRAMQ
jgi:hypothetical protein